jgi:hypothetical protein
MLPPFMPKPIKARRPAVPVGRKPTALIENGLKAPLRVLGSNGTKSDASDTAPSTKGTS